MTYISCRLKSVRNATIKALLLHDKDVIIRLLPFPSKGHTTLPVFATVQKGLVHTGIPDILTSIYFGNASQHLRNPVDQELRPQF